MLSFVAPYAESAMAQSALELQLAAFDTEIVTEPSAARGREALGLVDANDLSEMPPLSYFSTGSVIVTESSAAQGREALEVINSNDLSETPAPNDFSPHADRCEGSITDKATLLLNVGIGYRAIDVAHIGATVVGIASTYNPYRDGYRSQEKQTASGELYDPATWTAAIRIDLRQQFGGVRYGNSYRPTYALVESAGKSVIVKINDVGPLKPGRVIDLNEQSMRYFDPSMQAGLIRDVKVSRLAGEDWIPGPIDKEQNVRLAVAR